MWSAMLKVGGVSLRVLIALWNTQGALKALIEDDS